MDSPIDMFFADDLEPRLDTLDDLETALLWNGGFDAPHAEDAFLADFARWLGARGANAAERRGGLELAREALELVGDPDGAWQTLPIERWLQAAHDSDRASSDAVELARDLVAFLGEHGRLSLHGQRLLARRIARARVCSGTGQPSAEHTGPKLAA
jgi:hypothetical protein